MSRLYHRIQKNMNARQSNLSMTPRAARIARPMVRMECSSDTKTPSLWKDAASAMIKTITRATRMGQPWSCIRVWMSSRAVIVVWMSVRVVFVRFRVAFVRFRVVYVLVDGG